MKLVIQFTDGEEALYECQSLVVENGFLYMFRNDVEYSNNLWAHMIPLQNIFVIDRVFEKEHA